MPTTVSVAPIAIAQRSEDLRMHTTYSRGFPAGKPLQIAVQKEIFLSPGSEE